MNWINLQLKGLLHLSKKKNPRVVTLNAKLYQWFKLYNLQQGEICIELTLHNYEMQNKANKAYLQEQNTK